MKKDSVLAGTGCVQPAWPGTRDSATLDRGFGVRAVLTSADRITQILSGSPVAFYWFGVGKTSDANWVVPLTSARTRFYFG